MPAPPTAASTIHAHPHAPPPIHIPAGVPSSSSTTPMLGPPHNGIVRKHSPDIDDGRLHSAQPGQKPTKRARRAINCAPCRASKLKCDRARPCSGCVLRGTTSQCYTNDDGDSGRPEDYRNDPHNGIAQIRQGLAIVEAYFNRYGSLPPPPTLNHSSSNGRGESPPQSARFPLKRELDGEIVPHSAVVQSNPAPGDGEMMPDPGKGGLYIGPTSASALLSYRNGSKHTEEEPTSPADETGAVCTLDPLSNLDLLSMLPEVQTADALIHFYFDNCTWVHSYLHHAFFLPSWERFKSSTCTDHVLLATIFIVLALAVLYLPPDHPLLIQLAPQGAPRGPMGAFQLAANYYASSYNAMNRHRSQGTEMASPSLELIEYMLLRTQYLSIVKDDCEEVWHIRGEVLSYATALGLHRDPGRWRLNAETVERRRWIWWNVVALERWHAFLVGRPLAIANHHFDTLLPDGTDAFSTAPAHQPSHAFATHCQFFRLCVILGEILDTALSVHRVPYDRIIGHDRALARWADGLPPECRIEPYPLARALHSPHPEQRKLAIQALHLTSAMYHIQFTLHRPFTVPSSSNGRGGEPRYTPEAQRSYEAAVFAADKLISFVCGTLDQADAESKARIHGHPSPLQSWGHMGWGPYHIFHAAMFYSFQLIWQAAGIAPVLPAHAENQSQHLRADVRRVITVFERMHSQGIRVAPKALSILRALAPLYEEVCVDKFEGECELKMNAQLEFVRRLAFPWKHAASSPPPASAHPMPTSAGGMPHTHGTGQNASPSSMGPHHNSSPQSSMVYTPTGPTSNGLDHHQPPQQPQQQQQPSVSTSYAGIMGPVSGGPPMAYNMHSDEGVWSASLALDSDQWNRFLERVPAPSGGPPGAGSGGGQQAQNGSAGPAGNGLVMV